MTTPLEELEPELVALLQAEKSRPGPGAAVQARVREQLASALGPQAFEPGSPSDARAGPSEPAQLPSETGSALSSVGAAIKGKLLVATVAFATGGLTGAGVHAVVSREAPPPAPPPSAPAPLTYSPPPMVESWAAPPPVPPSRPKRVPAPAPYAQQELLLLEQARTALARADAQSALAALSLHQQQYPRGKWTEEREALKVQALMAGGRRGEAQAAAQAFVERYPASLLRPVVEAVLNEGKGQ